MKGRSLITLTLLTVVAAGCDKIPFLGGGSDAGTATDSTADTAVAETPAPEPTPTDAATEPEPTEAAPPPSTPAAAPQPSRPPQQGIRAASGGAAVAEVPWTPTQAGTVDPGMTRAEAVAQWGEPILERVYGEWTFMYYRNGCERRCGTFDVLFLQGGQVVDAVVRAPEHGYSGVSSSPPERQAMFTPPTATPDTLRING